MASAESSSSTVLFAYSLAEHHVLPLQQRLEQERASRRIAQSDWARHVQIRDKSLRFLIDMRRGPLHGEFPVQVSWPGPTHLFQSNSESTLNPPATAASVETAEHQVPATRVATLRQQPSDELHVEIIVIKTARTSAELSVILQADTRLQVHYLDLPRGDDGFGAKLICREEHRAAIQRHLNAEGAELKGPPRRIVLLEDMLSSFFIVSDEFRAIVSGIIDAQPANMYLRPVSTPLIQVPLTADHPRMNQAPQTGVLTHDDDEELPSSSAVARRTRRSRPYPSATGRMPSSSSQALTSASSRAAPAISAGGIESDPAQTMDDGSDTGRASDEVPTTEPDEDDSDDEAGNDRSSGQMQQASEINSRESHSIVIDRTFIRVSLPASEGGQTASTGKLRGVDPRRRAKVQTCIHRESQDSQTSLESSPPATQASILSDSLQSASVAPSTPSISLSSRLNINSQEADNSQDASQGNSVNLIS